MNTPKQHLVIMHKEKEIKNNLKNGFSGGKYSTPER